MLYFLLTYGRIVRFYLFPSQRYEICIAVMFLGQSVVFTVLVRAVLAIVT